jgi:hypothetical protein
MELLTNPWFIVFIAINILALIYLAKKFHYKPKNEPLLFERLRDADVHITIRTPPKPSDLKGGDTDCNQNNNP